ncbi:MAG: hypothetical protein LBR86_06235 [Tannerella sp.]|jgi:hypothetical protein|nr:hypothetical protein [Tannerella sp.]
MILGLNMIWEQKKDRDTSVGSMNEIHAGFGCGKIAFGGKWGAKASVNLSVYNSPIVKMPFSRRKKEPKLPFLLLGFGFFGGKYRQINGLICSISVK